MPTWIEDENLQWWERYKNPRREPACTHREHNPPGHIVIRPGQVLIHICPGCGKRVELRAGFTYCDLITTL